MNQQSNEAIDLQPVVPWISMQADMQYQMLILQSQQCRLG
jgi:hypothetical protein